MPLWTEPLHVLSIGAKNLKPSLEAQHIRYQVLEWSPPSFDDPDTGDALSHLADNMDITLANDRAMDAIRGVKPLLRRLVLAKDALAVFELPSVVVAGPPISFGSCIAPLQASIISAAVLAGYGDEETVKRELEMGGIHLLSSDALPVATSLETVITAETVLMELVDENNTDRKLFVPLLHAEATDGIDGWAVHEETSVWVTKVLVPIFNQVLATAKGMSCAPLIRDGLQMGDDGRYCVRAMQLLFESFCTAQLMVESGLSRSMIYNVLLFVKSQPSLMRHLVLGVSKLSLEAGTGVPNCSLITSIIHNGSAWGVRVSGLDRLFVIEDHTEGGNEFLGDYPLVDLWGMGLNMIAYSSFNHHQLGNLVAPAASLIKQSSDRSYGLHQFFKVSGNGVPLGYELRSIVEQGNDLSFLALSSNYSRSGRSARLKAVSLSVCETVLQAFSESLSINA